MEKPTQTKEENEKKVSIDGKRGETSWTRTILFLILFFILSIFMLQKWYFLDPEAEYNVIDSVVPEVSKKNKQISDFELDVFDSEKYRQLEDDRWHEFNEDELTKGNPQPFRRIDF